MPLRRALILALLAWTLSLRAAHAQCEWQWRNYDAAPSNTVRGFYPWDVDGDGASELFVGGNFSEIGGVTVKGLAVWDGVEFSGFADAPFLSVHDVIEFRRELYCLGNNLLHRWTGTEWEYIEGAPLPIYGLLVHDDNLIVHGPLTRCIKRWDGQFWYDYGSGMSDGYLGDDPVVDDVAIYNGELYACGNFNVADGQFCTTVVRWDGTTWQSLEGGPEPSTNALHVIDGLLYAGGSSSSPWHHPLCYWNGTEWALVQGLDGSVTELGEFNGQLVLVGNFDEPFESVAFWDGQSFSGLGRGICEDGLGDTAPFAIAEYNGDLLIGGSFSQVDRLPIKNFGIWTYAPDGDANGDLKVDLSDLGIVLRSFSTCNGNPLYDPAAGRLGDSGNFNCVDLEDLGEVLASWGASCE